MSKGLVWECECGSIDYGENPPVECKDCSLIGNFVKVPEELITEKVEGNILSLKPTEDEGEEEDEI